MALTEKDIRAIAEYARIGLTDEEAAEMTVYMNKTIQTLDTIKEYDVEGVEPTFYPIGDLTNVMREDTEKPSFTQEVALQNAPAEHNGSFLIPSILGGEGDC